MLNIVIPMAGRGSRFQEVGYELPKPLIPVHGQPMIRLVIENLRPAQPHRFIFICLAEHLDRYDLAARLSEWAPGCEVLTVDRVTEGAACTVLLSRHLIDNADPLMIANSDQWVDVGIDTYLETMEHESADGLIMTMRACDPKWSFVRFDDRGSVCEVVEKKVVSNEATVGIYNFRHGSSYVQGADRMIAKNLRVNNEFYVAPVYNELIDTGARVAIYNVGQESAGMHGLGIPSDLISFLEHPVSERSQPAAWHLLRGINAVNVISHRGFWECPGERNTPEAFLRSWKHGFGIETDVRDLAGRLVISHDPPAGSPMTFEQFLEEYKRHGQGTQLALNVKSDGLHTLMAAALRDFEVGNYFVFDMSIPDSLGYFNENLNVYTRHSELEPCPAFVGKATGVWLDMFVSEWPSVEQIRQHLDRHLPVCLVSPELHKRSPEPFWTWLKSNGLHTSEQLTLCTDLPAKAEGFFHESN